LIWLFYLTHLIEEEKRFTEAIIVHLDSAKGFGGGPPLAVLCRECKVRHIPSIPWMFRDTRTVRRQDPQQTPLLIAEYVITRRGLTYTSAAFVCDGSEFWA
jgi:hypothetical protein